MPGTQSLVEFTGNFLMDRDQFRVPRRACVFYFGTAGVHTSVIVLIRPRHELGRYADSTQGNPPRLRKVIRHSVTYACSTTRLALPPLLFP